MQSPEWLPHCICATHFRALSICNIEMWRSCRHDGVVANRCSPRRAEGEAESASMSAKLIGLTSYAEIGGHNDLGTALLEFVRSVADKAVRSDNAFSSMV